MNLDHERLETVKDAKSIITIVYVNLAYNVEHTIRFFNICSVNRNENKS